MTIKQQGGIFGRNPTFNNVTVDGDLSIAGGVDLGAAPVIGDGSANAALTINKGASSTGTVFFQQNSLASGYIQYDAFERFISQSAGSSFWRAGNTADKLELTTTGDFKVNVGNLVIGTSGKGIDFSATAGTGTSELFDDYEEGTWTPTTAGDATGSFSNQWGSYVKIGRFVLVQFQFAVSVNFTSTFIGGLPYSVSGGGLSGNIGVFSANASTTQDFVVSTAGIGFLSAPSTTIGTYRGMATYLTA